MTLVNEAAYLYVFSKKLLKITEQLRKLRHKAETHAQEQRRSKDHKQRNSHFQKQAKTADKIKEKQQEYTQTLQELRRHQVAFAGQLQKEMKG